MDLPDAEGDDIYQVPRTSTEAEDSVMIPDSFPREDAPPALRPKTRGSEFKRASSLLDRQAPASLVHPAPRRTSSLSKSNLEALVSDAAPGSSESNPSFKPVKHTSPSTSPYVAANRHVTDEAFITRLQVQSAAKSSTTGSEKPSSGLSKERVVVEATAHKPLVQTQSPVAAKRPIPKPRTKVPSTLPQTSASQSDCKVPSPVLQTSASQSDCNTTDLLPSTTLNDSKEQANKTQSKPHQEQLSSDSHNEMISSIGYNLPPDPDTLEIMLNEEVDKKYGISSSQNELKPTESSDTIVKNNETPQKLVNDKSNDDENNEYIDPDSVVKSLQSVSVQNNDRLPAPPKSHSTPDTTFYLQMKNKFQQGSDSSNMPSTSPGKISPVLEHSDTPLKASPVQNPSASPDKISLLPKSQYKIDLGFDLSNESSTDRGSTVSGKEPQANSAEASGVMKPFQNIQPFKPSISLHSDSSISEREQEPRPHNIDISDFDPLFVDKSKSFPTPQTNLFEKLNNSNSNKIAQNDPDSTKSVYTYATAEAIGETQESYYSQIGPSSKTTTPSNTLKSQTSRQSFHHDAPKAPPPPLPRPQNRIPEPKPPPVPPRPDNGTGPTNSPMLSLAPPISTATSSPLTSHANIFDGLPTPEFSQAQSSDPFAHSNFDYECLNFNKSQIPDPPARSPRPKIGHKKSGSFSQGAGASETAIDPKQDPERISQFVIPPPGSYIGQNASGYDLAKELSGSSSSDDEGADFPLEDIGHCWPGGAVPRDTPLKVFNGSLSPKKNTRDGYLYKQGGYKANKGWKKRWVVFNGTSLSYYSNNVSQISKRIIPIRCMVNVVADVKETDKNSFKFKVETSLKDRVFLFSAEKLEDCLTWANILMAAVTEYKKSFKNGSAKPQDKPDKEGFIKFSNMKKYYVTVTGKILSYYQSFDDFQMGSPIHEIDMKLASVKVKDHRKLQLWVHYGHIDLTFESDQEMQQWMLTMEDAIAEGLADDTVLKKVYENMSNQRCADCSVESPHWASINLGIVVCKNCAGVHRMFDHRISKIRSLRMDTRVWTPSLTEVMVIIGNANSNAFWECNLPEGAKIHPNEPMEKRIDFITKKYRHKKFCNLHPLANMGSALGEALLDAASSDNVLEVLRILFSGSNVLFRREEQSPTAYDVAKEHGQRLIMELLYQNGGDPQSLEQDATDANRLREDIRLQGFLNKTGPLGRKFEKRWCVLEHGALTYYLNEKSTTFKGSIDRKDMQMIQVVDTDKNYYSFEVSTGLKDNRIFTFASDCKSDTEEWMRTFAKLMAPVAVMDHMGMIDIKLAGYARIKESLVDEWHQTFVVFSWRGINYMNRDLKFDYIDLRKASGIKMQDSSTSYQQRGQCFVISSTGKSVYLQATLPRDTEKMYTSFLEAITSSGQTLNDQALTNENVPVIIDQCITHIHMHGIEEEGIYRKAGQNSRVQSLLDEFRKNPWSSMGEYTVQDVANALKRFLRELDDSVFERVNYLSWVNMAGCKEMSNRLKWYKYYLEKMPQVNFQTLKRIILHLLRVSQSEKVNMMSVTNLAACFAPSLLRVAKDEQPSLSSDSSGKEISIIVDLMKNPDYFFSVDENERMIMNNIQQAEDRMKEKKKSMSDTSVNEILIPVHLLSRDGEATNILVTEKKTAKDAMDYMKRNKSAPELMVYVLHELLFKGALRRPLFPEDIIATATKRWMEWESWVLEDSSVCLCVQGLDLLEKLSDNLNTHHVLMSSLYYCDFKPRSKFKKKMVGFRQYKLAIYDSQGVSELTTWNIEDITVYMGSMHKKPPTWYCLTFIVAGEKYTKPPFGHCLSFDTEVEMCRWAAALYSAQHPAGLLSWVSD